MNSINIAIIGFGKMGQIRYDSLSKNNHVKIKYIYELNQQISVPSKLKVNDLCRPCKDLQQRLDKSNIIKEFLRRGGLRCEILSSGTINVGDKITIKT